MLLLLTVTVNDNLMDPFTFRSTSYDISTFLDDRKKENQTVPDLYSYPYCDVARYYDGNANVCTPGSRIQ